MGGRHPLADQLLVDRESPVHRVAPQVKLVALVVFVAAVAVTPRRAVWAFALDAAVLVTVAALARVPVATVLRRLLVIAPFLAVGALLPFIGEGPTTAVGPLDLSTDGLWAAWNVAAKAALGATSSILLTATTPLPDILTGMARLRVPGPIVAIVASMLRYLDLTADQLGRMRTAMTARAHDPRWLWQARPVAAAAGTLFVRTYERGERVHQAMAARGFTGRLPDLDPAPTRAAGWLIGLAPAAVAVTAAAVALAP